MKSMKLASGFAVSALALAIAGQAAAQETTTEVEFTGSVKVQTVVDLENEAYFNTAPGLVEADEDWFNLEATWTVSNGPFSGDLIVGIEEATEASVSVDNLMVEEGPISFGQIGSVMDTDGVLETVTDEDNEGFGLDVDAALRYTVADFGLRVQTEGAGPDTDAIGEALAGGAGVGDELSTGGRNFGLAASVEQDLDVATVWADFQYRQFVNHVIPAETDDDGNVTGVDTDGIADSYDGMGDDYTVFGVAAEVTPIDMVTLTTAFQNSSLADDSAYGVKLDVDVAEGISAFGQFYDPSLESDDSEMFKVGGSADFAPIGFSASYKASAADAGEGVVETELTYTDGAYGASAEYEFNLAAETNTLTLGGTFTTESNVVFGTELDLLDQDDQLRAYAEYSF